MSKVEDELQEIKKSKKSFREKLSLLAIGTVVTIVTFLVSQYTSSFVTYAYYNKDRAVMGVILEKITNVEDDVREIKLDMKNKNKTKKSRQ